jgi:hypothetical protein
MLAVNYFRVSSTGGGDLAIGHDAPIEMSNSQPSFVITGEVSLASQRLSRLVIDSASTVRSLAFLPTNPAHEEIVDRLTAHRFTAVTSRKLSR